MAKELLSRLEPRISGDDLTPEQIKRANARLKAEHREKEGDNVIYVDFENKEQIEKPSEASAEEIQGEVDFFLGLAKNYMEDPRLNSLASGDTNLEEKAKVKGRLVREIENHLKFANESVSDNAEVIKAKGKLESVRDHVAGF